MTDGIVSEHIDPHLDAVCLCEKHTDMLVTSIESKGLGELIPKDKEAAEKQTKAWIENDMKPNAEGYNPMIEAFMAIMNNALRIVGKRIFDVEVGEGNRCVLCWLTADHERNCGRPDCKVENFDGWIDNAVNDEKQYVIENLI